MISKLVRNLNRELKTNINPNNGAYPWWKSRKNRTFQTAPPSSSNKLPLIFISVRALLHTYIRINPKGGENMANLARPISLSVIEGKKQKRSNEEIRRRKENEKALKVAKDKLKPPSWLGKIAKKEFKYIVDETQSIELLTNLDVHTLAVYSNVYEQYVICNQRLLEDGIIVEANKASETVTAAHPLFVKQAQLFDQLRKMQTDLGLSPSSRAKLALHAALTSDKSKEEEEFDNV